MAKTDNKPVTVPEAVAAIGRPTVAMKRDPDTYPAPHTADVYADAVPEWRAAGWVVAG
jgi:hypothetical protein